LPPRRQISLARKRAYDNRHNYLQKLELGGRRFEIVFKECFENVVVENLWLRDD